MNGNFALINHKWTDCCCFYFFGFLCFSFDFFFSFSTRTLLRPIECKVSHELKLKLDAMCRETERVNVELQSGINLKTLRKTLKQRRTFKGMKRFV